MGTLDVLVFLVGLLAGGIGGTALGLFLVTKYLGRAEGLAPFAPRTSRTRVEPLPATKALLPEPPDIDVEREQEIVAARARSELGLNPEQAEQFAKEVVDKGRTIMGRLSTPRAKRTA